MKKLFALLLFLPSAAFANIKQEFVTSAQISIDSPYVITNAAPSSYSISGNNITTSTGTGDSVVTNGIGGLNLGSYGISVGNKKSGQNNSNNPKIVDNSKNKVGIK